MTEIAMKWKEIEAQALELGKHYVMAFHLRFKIRPPDKFETTDLEILRWSITTHGLELGKRLMSTFLSFDDDWTQKRGHSLHQFKSMITKIMEEEGKKTPRAYASMTNRMYGQIACDSCWKVFYAIYPLNTDFDKTFIRCPECMKENRGWKYPTLQEWRSNHSGNYSEKMYRTIFKTKHPFPPERVLLDYEVPDMSTVK